MKTFKDYEHDSGRQMEKEKKPKPVKDQPAREAPKVKFPPEKEGAPNTAPMSPEPVVANPWTFKDEMPTETFLKKEAEKVTPPVTPKAPKPVKPPVVDPGKIVVPEPSPEPKHKKVEAHVHRVPKHDKVVPPDTAEQDLPSNSEEVGRRF